MILIDNTNLEIKGDGATVLTELTIAIEEISKGCGTTPHKLVQSILMAIDSYNQKDSNENTENSIN